MSNAVDVRCAPTEIILVSDSCAEAGLQLTACERYLDNCGPTIFVQAGGAAGSPFAIGLATRASRTHDGSCSIRTAFRVAHLGALAGDGSRSRGRSAPFSDFA
jgi:hypothetical protein